MHKLFEQFELPSCQCIAKELVKIEQYGDFKLGDHTLLRKLFFQIFWKNLNICFYMFWKQIYFKKRERDALRDENFLNF